MTKLQMGRRAIWAMAAMLAAATAPLRSARAQAREDQGHTGGRRQAGSPGSGGATSSLIWARHETEVRQALQDSAAEGLLPMFDPRTHIEQTSPLFPEPRENEGMTWG